MVEQGPVQRKLAAILAADVAGYSRLMGADEEGTLARLKALRAGMTATVTIDIRRQRTLAGLFKGSASAASP